MHRRHHRTISPLLITGLLAFVLAACGGKERTDEAAAVREMQGNEDNPADTQTAGQPSSIRQVSPIDSAIAFEITIGDSLPPCILRFRPDWTARKFDTIIVSRQGAEIQRLAGFGMEEGTVAQTDDPASYFTARDLNFDGYLDLQLLIGGSNTSHKYYYWIYNPATHQFVVDATLKSEQGSPWINQKEKTVMFHTNQGCSGRCYTRNTYSFDDSTHHFVLIRQETQIATGVRIRKSDRDDGDRKIYYDDNPNARYVRTIKELKDGKLEVTSRKTLSGGEAM